MAMDYLKLATVIFSATGFWKLVELAIRFRVDNKKQLAEIDSLRAQSDSQIVGNWMQWAQMLEKRIKELEVMAGENSGLKAQIEGQRRQIAELESKVSLLEKENEQLHARLKELTQSQEP